MNTRPTSELESYRDDIARFNPHAQRLAKLSGPAKEEYLYLDTHRKK